MFSTLKLQINEQNQHLKTPKSKVLSKISQSFSRPKQVNICLINVK